ncbi:MAG: hypothetical protein ACI89U_000336 [Gammaproteobacteria bacterium]|jgi:hypothetical protein
MLLKIRYYFVVYSVLMVSVVSCFTVYKMDVGATMLYFCNSSVEVFDRKMFLNMQL